MVPKMASHPIEPLTFLYFTSVASTLGAGSVSSVSFARNFQSVPVSLIGAAFAIAAFPALSTAAAAGDRRGFTPHLPHEPGDDHGAHRDAGPALALVGTTRHPDPPRRRSLRRGRCRAHRGDPGGVRPLGAAREPHPPARRALYATKNTFLPALASITGFVAIVVAAGTLAPRLGLAGVPAAFAIGMGVKVAMLAAGLVPRMAGIGSHGPPGDRRRSPPPRRVLGMRRPATRRRRGGVASWRSSSLGLGASFQALGRRDSCRWRHRSAVGARASARDAGRSAITAADAIGPAAPGSPTPSPSPSPTPGPFAMDLYQKGDYAGEFRDTWCVPAAMQTSMNIMDVGADVTAATQQSLWTYARSLVPDQEGGAEPEAWAMGLTGSATATTRSASSPPSRRRSSSPPEQVRLTNRPGGAHGLEGRPLLGHVGVRGDRATPP